MQTRMEQWGIVAKLVETMRSDNSWAGETHIQKTMFFLKNVLKVPTLYDFVLYMHGPYSFELHDDLVAMRVNGIVGLRPQTFYGARFELGQFGPRAISRSKDAVARYEKHIQFMSEHIGCKDIRTLERYSTALHVKTLVPTADDTTIKDEIMRLKPHIPAGPALQAVKAVAQIEQEAVAAGLITLP